MKKYILIITILFILIVSFAYASECASFTDGTISTNPTDVTNAINNFNSCSNWCKIDNIFCGTSNEKAEYDFCVGKCESQEISCNARCASQFSGPLYAAQLAACQSGCRTQATACLNKCQVNFFESQKAAISKKLCVSCGVEYDGCLTDKGNIPARYTDNSFNCLDLNRFCKSCTANPKGNGIFEEVSGKNGWGTDKWGNQIQGKVRVLDMNNYELTGRCSGLLCGELTTEGKPTIIEGGKPLHEHGSGGTYYSGRTPQEGLKLGKHHIELELRSNEPFKVSNRLGPANLELYEDAKLYGDAISLNPGEIKSGTVVVDNGQIYMDFTLEQGSVMRTSPTNPLGTNFIANNLNWKPVKRVAVTAVAFLAGTLVGAKEALAAQQTTYGFKGQQLRLRYKTQPPQLPPPPPPPLTDRPPPSRKILDKELGKIPTEPAIFDQLKKRIAPHINERIRVIAVWENVAEKCLFVCIKVATIEKVLLGDKGIFSATELDKKIVSITKKSKIEKNIMESIIKDLREAGVNSNKFRSSIEKAMDVFGDEKRVGFGKGKILTAAIEKDGGHFIEISVLDESNRVAHFDIIDITEEEFNKLLNYQRHVKLPKATRVFYY